jgi:hypothetical protein
MVRKQDAFPGRNHFMAAFIKSEFVFSIVLILTFMAGNPLRFDNRGLPLAFAQLTPVGNAENAVGALIVRRTDGRVEQLRGKGSFPLYEGDECKTERGGKAFIRLTDGTQLAMNEETTFVVRARTERSRGVIRIFKLMVGEMWMKTPGARPIEIETPVATAAIKGTEFDIRVLADGASTLTVIEGVVEFGTPFGTCPIPSATQSVGERGKRCTRPAPVDVAPVIEWIKAVTQ